MGRARGTSGGREPGHILIIDDDPGTLGLIAHALERAGYAVRVASSVPEALDLCAEVEPALLIVDIDLARVADSGTVELLDHDATLSFPVLVHGVHEAASGTQASRSADEELAGLVRLVGNVLGTPPLQRGQSAPAIPGTRLDPTEQEMRRGREALLRHLRWVGRLDPRDVAAPFRHGNPRHLHAFRRLLALREAAPGASGQMAAILASADADIADRLESVPSTAPELPLRSLQHLISRRSYRRIHSAALGAGAAMMWGVPSVLTERHWRHGNATALLTQLVCEGDRELRDQAYAAGLLHDLGRLAITQFDPGPWGTHDRDRWSGRVVYYADALGRAVVDGLEFPSWLRTRLLPCGLPPGHPDRLLAVIHASCGVAHELGVDGLGGKADTAVGEPIRGEVRAALDAAGGVEWLEARMRGPLLAARAGLRVALAVA